MSNLPSYLGRGINNQEKAISIGVLDWGNLKKWQHKQKLKLRGPRGPYASYDELSLPFLTDGLPSNSADHSHAPVHERIHGSQSQTAPYEVLHNFKSLDEIRQHKIQETYQALEDYGESEVDASRRKCMDKRTFQKNEILPSIRSSRPAYSPKEKINVRGSATEKKPKELHESNDHRVVVPLARCGHNDHPKKYAYSTDILITRLEEAEWGSFLEKPKDSEVGSSIPQSRILPSILDHHKHLQQKKCGSFDFGPSTCNSSKHVAEAALASRLPGTSTRKDLRKCQSSPHSRLLDPEVQAEENFHLQCIEPLPQSSVPMDTACKPLNSPSTWSSRLKCCRTVDVSDSQLGKSKMSTAQALLRMAFKNGRPMFTFAVNAESDILAASMKKLSTSRKCSCRWTYTLVKIPALKREMAGKMKGGKVGTQYSCPIMVSQLKVSEAYSKSIRQKEFVLFPVEPRKDELAAIVVQIPAGEPNTVLCSYHCEASKVTSEGHSLESSCPKDGENMQDQSLFSDKDLINATVVLPSGVHTLPSKGEPSSLIERWKSGGSCDCGGWDLDCKIRVLVNQNHICNELRSSKAYTSSYIDKLAVFTQVPIYVLPHLFYSICDCLLTIL